MFRYIKSQAFSKSQVIDKLENNIFECLVHLAKIWVFPNSVYDKHWKHEIWSMYKRVSKMKPRNKLPDPNFIYDHTFAEYKDKLSEVIQMAVDEEYDLIPNYERAEDLVTFSVLCKEYFKWLSEYLSKNEVVSSKTVSNKLLELGF